jgi:hypothetical protein
MTRGAIAAALIKIKSPANAINGAGDAGASISGQTAPREARPDAKRLAAFGRQPQ